MQFGKIEPSECLIPEEYLIKMLTNIEVSQSLSQQSLLCTLGNLKQYVDKLTSMSVEMRQIILTILAKLVQRANNFSTKTISKMWSMYLLVATFGLEALIPEFQRKSIRFNDSYFYDIFTQVARNAAQEGIEQILSYVYGDGVAESVWIELFRYTNYKSIHFALMSFYFYWNTFFNSKNCKTSSTTKFKAVDDCGSLKCLQRVCFFLIKYSEKIKESQNFESLNLLLSQLKKRFVSHYRRELEACQKVFQSESLLEITEVCTGSRHQKVWEKLTLCQLVCASKGSINGADKARKVESLLKDVERSRFIERLINSQNRRFFKKELDEILNPEQVEHLLFCAIVNVLLHLNVDHEFQEAGSLPASVRETSWQFLELLSKREISVLMVRHLVKQLQITNLTEAVQHWKTVFQLMKLLLTQYPTSRDILELQDNYSYISRRLPDCGYPLTIDLSLKGESIPEKEEKILIQFWGENSDRKVWLTMRNYIKGEIILSFLKVEKDLVLGKEQKEFSWNQYRFNTFQIRVDDQSIRVTVNGSACLTVSNSIRKFEEIVLCDRDIGMGSTVSQLLSFTITYQKAAKNLQPRKIDIIEQHLKSESPKDTLKVYKCKAVFQESFVEFIRVLGDLDLFILILSHTLKKIKDSEEILQMIRASLGLMEAFADQKGVRDIELSREQKEERRNSILCLCWFFAKDTKSVAVILELMRFLHIRGHREHEEQLKFLCNFAFWKEFRLEEQILIVLQIRELLRESLKTEKKVDGLAFCRSMLFDMILFHKASHYLMEEREVCLKLHRNVLETVFEQIKGLLELNSKRDKLFLLQIFKFVEFVIKMIACVLNRKISENFFDLQIAVELSLLLKEIGKQLFYSKDKKVVSKKDIDLSLEEFFKKDEKELMPLSTSSQEAQDERYLMFLTRIISQTKSLISIFEAETVYVEDSKIRVYPIFQEAYVECSETKMVSSIMTFNVYMHMLSDKSWHYLMVGSPAQGYEDKFHQILWRVSFYDLLKDKKHFKRLTKMLELSNFPRNEYCAMKVFEAVLVSSVFEMKYLFRILKDPNFLRIPSATLTASLKKLFDKLSPEAGETTDETDFAGEDPTVSLSSVSIATSQIEKEQKIYYTLLHSEQIEYSDCHQLVVGLKCRKMYDSYRIIVHHLVIRCLVRFIKQYIRSSRTGVSPKKPSTEKIPLKTKVSERYRKLSEISQCSIELLDTSERFHGEESAKLHTQELNLQSQEQKIKLLITASVEALQFYYGAIKQKAIKEFTKVQSKEDCKAHCENFCLNIEGATKALRKFEKESKNSELHSFVSFIEVHLQQYSEFLIYSRNPLLRPEEGPMNTEQAKKGKKYLYKTMHVDLQRESTDFFIENNSGMRIQLHSLLKVWSQIEKKNKFFWSLFINSKKYYSLSDITSRSGERLHMAVTNEKPKLELPKMMKNQSLLHSVSLISDKNDAYDESENSSTLFEDCQIYPTDIDRSGKKQSEHAAKQTPLACKEPKTVSFKVFLVKNDKIYQGILSVHSRRLRFEETYTNLALYEKICAHEKERRTDDEVEKEPYSFDILLNQRSIFIHKKYLFFEVALEIWSNEKSHFFCFESSRKRDRFCQFLSPHKDNIYTFEGIVKMMRTEAEKWSKGLYSNYEYLMKVNQFAGRSVNDISQYFVMPWTVIQFDTKVIDKSFLRDESNFRDLRKPLGKIFESKWKQIMERYQNSFGARSGNKTDLQPFLYGSFYSNPAIVTNYMIRLQPFSALHYYLQSEKFDVADRLFFQFSDQFRSIKNSIGDVKELIPQFYNNPEILKNRSELNLGLRQNKEIVNDVRMPKWAENPQEFIFKMKFFLESPIVSEQLSHWVDLIFGVNARRENALAADNLFMSEVYGPNGRRNEQSGNRNSNGRKSAENMKVLTVNKESKNSSVSSLQGRLCFYKQFGQIPGNIFHTHHPTFSQNSHYYEFKGESHQLCELQLPIQAETENYGVVVYGSTIEIFEVHSGEFCSSKQNWKSLTKINGAAQVVKAEIVNLKVSGSFLPYLFYNKKGHSKLYFRQIRKAKLFSSFEVKEEGVMLSGCSRFSWVGSELLLVSLKNVLRIFQFGEDSCGVNAERRCFKLAEKVVEAREFTSFTQHKAEIKHILFDEEERVILTADELNKAFLIKFYPDGMELINQFEVKNHYFDEKVERVALHRMSLILFLTSYNRVIALNFLGDFLGAQELLFAQSLETAMQERALFVQFFNKNSADLIIATDRGNLWKVDLFELFKMEIIQEKEIWCEKMSLCEEGHSIKSLLLQRVGRHWKLISASQTKSKKVQILSTRCLTWTDHHLKLL